MTLLKYIFIAMTTYGLAKGLYGAALISLIAALAMYIASDKIE